jgi:glycerophosphoryl diester phosphodiesterase
MLRIGHKGADALAPGNTLESFAAAVEAGVDAIEFDVLRPRADFGEAADWRDAPAGPAQAGGPLLVAHDWGDAGRREPITLADALDALTRPPLDGIRFDLDLKVTGREDEIAAAIAERGLTERAMVSTMEIPSLVYLRDKAPEIARGWTLPKVSRDWSRSPWLLVEAAHSVGVQVIAWTVDEAERIARLETMDVDGICTNDPRLLNVVTT